MNIGTILAACGICWGCILFIVVVVFVVILIRYPFINYNSKNSLQDNSKQQDSSKQQDISKQQNNSEQHPAWKK